MFSISWIWQKNWMKFWTKYMFHLNLSKHNVDIEKKIHVPAFLNCLDTCCVMLIPFTLFISRQPVDFSSLNSNSSGDNGLTSAILRYRYYGRLAPHSDSTFVSVCSIYSTGPSCMKIIGINDYLMLVVLQQSPN